MTAGSRAATCAIALGSNLGKSQTILESALHQLDRAEGIELIQRSSWYRTAPVGPPQPDYLNGCATLRTRQSPERLLQTLLDIERQFGRVRRERWGARTLDLDLLLYDDVILDTPFLQLPHPRMTERAFVLVPLAEIAPDWLEPKSKKAIADLVGVVNCSGIEKLEPS